MASGTGVLNTQYKWHQVKECLRDPQPWLLAVNAFLQCIQGGGLTSVSLTQRQITLPRLI
jgi:ACS family allantoate permease-like MFS transporter